MPFAIQKLHFLASAAITMLNQSTHSSTKPESVTAASNTKLAPVAAEPVTAES